MPCYRCGVRQTDPAKGPSPWKRGVAGGSLVLVCPDCQRIHDWQADLDHCPSCASPSLTRALGETTCKACGAVVPDGAAAEPAPSDAVAGLAADVAAALDRTLHAGDDAPR